MITIEHGSGHVVGASIGERLGIAAMRLAALLLRPLDKFGLSRVTRFISSLWPSGNVVRVGLAEDAAFEMPYGEGYWARLLPRRWEYEGEIESVLTAIAPTEFTFLDCGANYGLWSVLVSSRRFGNHPAIAIEAAPDTYTWLERNCAGNECRSSPACRSVETRASNATLTRNLGTCRFAARPNPRSQFACTPPAAAKAIPLLPPAPAAAGRLHPHPHRAAHRGTPRAHTCWRRSKFVGRRPRSPGLLAPHVSSLTPHCLLDQLPPPAPHAQLLERLQPVESYFPSPRLGRGARGEGPRLAHDPGSSA